MKVLIKNNNFTEILEEKEIHQLAKNINSRFDIKKIYLRDTRIDLTLQTSHKEIEIRAKDVKELKELFQSIQYVMEVEFLAGNHVS